jgi:hypothetical protein
VHFPRLFALGLLLSAAAPRAVFAGNDTVPTPGDTSRPPNQLPEFQPGRSVRPRIADDGSNRGPLLRVGRTVRVTVVAEDPDGDPLKYRVQNLPRGATFDAESGVLTWKPGSDQVGDHEIVFEASDGRATARQTSILVVRPNRAPLSDAEGAIFFVARTKPASGWGDVTYTPTIARDFDADELSFVVERQPPGARLQASAGSVDISWKPTDADAGDHALVVRVSDGELTTRIERTLVVLPESVARDYLGMFLLGGGASGFLTHGDGDLYLGGAIDATVVAIAGDGRRGWECAHGSRQDDCHASHHRFYAEFEILDALESGAPSLFTYGAGYSASFEYYPARRYLIPHYGVELGGLVQDGLGHRVQTRPYLGLHLWADRHVWLNLALGYRVVPAELVRLSGPTATLRAVVNPW